MLIKTISILIYPIISSSISGKQKDLVKEILEKEFTDISNDQIDEAFNIILTKDELLKLTGQTGEQDKKNYFRIAKEITRIFDYSKESLIALGELGKALNIASKETGFDFDLYNINEINQNEFQKTVKNFSIVSAAIGFLPIPISDFAILLPIQVGMVAKISNIYDFKMDPKQFVKMTGGVLGIGLILKFTARLINNFIPVLGWGINASIAFAGTYAIAIITKRYIEANGNLTKESIKSIWEKSYEEGKKEFSNLKEFIYKKKDELITEIEKYKNKIKKYSKDEDSQDESKNDTTLQDKPKQTSNPKKKNKSDNKSTDKEDLI